MIKIQNLVVLSTFIFLTTGCFQPTVESPAKTNELIPTKTIPYSPTPKANATATFKSGPTVEEPTIQPSPTPEPSPTVYTIEDFVNDYVLDNIDDIRKEYKRTGKIYLNPLDVVSKDDMGEYSLAFKEEIDNDLYNLGFDDRGWFLDTNSYPLGKEDITEEIWRWVEGRSGDVVITDGDKVIHRIARLDFYVPTPTAGPSGGNGGGGEDSCPAPRQKPGGGCCPAGTVYNPVAGCVDDDPF